MVVLETVAAMRAACQAARARHGLGVQPDENVQPGTRELKAGLGLVPTMGALHAGHLSLVARARAQNEVVAVTIFVNPLQFGPGEDFDRYPKQLERDLALLRDVGADLVFTPSPAEMYPAGARTAVEVAGTDHWLDGAHRPGHFRGVATVVAKLFGIVAPDRAYFGQKDAVQIAVLRRMVRDLNFAVELIACPIVRDADGLALSSRNAYLSPEERRQALALPRALNHMQALLQAGEQAAGELLAAGRALLAREPAARVEYLEAIAPESLEMDLARQESSEGSLPGGHELLRPLHPHAPVRPGTLVAVAAQVGSTRLIDNFIA